MFAQYFVRVAFVVIMVWGLFFLPGVAYGQESGESGEVIDAPPANGGPLIPIGVWLGRAAWVALGVGVGAAATQKEVKIPLPSFDMEKLVEPLVSTFLTPIVAAFSIVIALWIVLTGFRVVTSFVVRRD